MAGLKQIARRDATRAAGTTGFQYADKLGTPSGFNVLKLKAGQAGKPVIATRSKGELVDVPALPLTTPVLVQLSADGGACFEAEYRMGGISQNTTKQFKAKGGAPLP